MNEFRKMLLNDDYIKWLAKFLEEYGKFDDLYFVHNHHLNLSQNDLMMIEYLGQLMKELNRYVVKKNMYYETLFSYSLLYQDEIYVLEYDNEGYSVTKCSGNESKLPCIEYSEFKKSLVENMQINFDLLRERIVDSLKHTDLEFIRNELSKLLEPTVFCGVGGSSVVSEFAAKVINQKNGVLTVNSEPRDFIYRNNDSFRNVVACSYSGNHYGIEMSFSNDLKKYLLSSHLFDDANVTYLNYITTIAKEQSFISLGTTLIPVSILMDYYLKGNNHLMLDLIEKKGFSFDTKSNIYEIFSGYDTSAASKYLETTMVESGIGIPIVHDKYDYCHGRSTLNRNYDGIAVYYNRNTEFDKMLLEELKRYYRTIVVIDSKFQDQILDDYQMLIQSMYLTKYIAEKKSMDLSAVNFSPMVKRLYKYYGEI